MTQQPELSKLCELCEHINFAAILTPREYDRDERRTKAIYRPEWNGNGPTPIADWMSTKERKNFQYPLGSLKVRLPLTKTAIYGDLSGSEEQYEEEIDWPVYPEDRAVVVVGERGEKDDDDSEDEEEHKDDDRGGDSSGKWDWLTRELSDIEDDDAQEPETRENPDNSDGDDSVSTWSGNSHYTENNRIDLNKQAAGNWTYSHGDLYYLGSIWDVRSRRWRCDLCRAFWHKMRNNADLRDKFIVKSRCILKLMELKGRRVEDPTREVKTLNLTFIYGYKLDDPRRSEWICKNPMVLSGTHRDVCESDDQTPPGQIPVFYDKHYGEARWCHRHCDFGLLRGWLNTCATKHDHPLPNSHVKIKVRLIDIDQMCLVEFDASDSTIPEYAALSYTWGDVTPRCTLKKFRLRQSKTPGFYNSEELNTTFRDAFDLCSGMHVRYLWIDALCIIQDSVNDKLQQVPQMREIYGRSLFTIVAAHGKNANAGLPRVSGAGSSQFKLELKDIRVQLKGSCKMYVPANRLDIGFTENYIRGCAYLSRAWTFQEGFLSPRLLIFTKDKVYWECERCTWCDDTHWESDEIDFVGLRAIKGATPGDVWNDRFERHAYDLRPQDDEDPIPPQDTYAAVVKEYSNRNLSYGKDILHACAGVLAYIKEEEQSEFLYGLREKHFGNDLLFNYWTALASRFPGWNAIESGFPSWSWTAWKGSIQIANQPRGNSYDLAENLVPCDGVRCFTLYTDERGTLDLRPINRDGGWKFELGYVRRGEGIYDPTELNYEYDAPTGRLEIPKRLRSWYENDPDDDVENRADNDVVGRSNKKPEIPVYDQNVTLAELVKHPAFGQMRSDLHIVFKTFSTLVVVVTDHDDYVIRMKDVDIVGTVTLRSEGVWGNKDEIARKVYACKKIANDLVSRANRPPPHDPDDYACPCCGKDPKRQSIPQGFELGPYLGRLPALSTAWDEREYMKAIPNGVYRMLWMNNNQLPMFGHLLCKPVSPTALKDGRWKYEILQRVSAVIGPTEIITKEAQEHYCAEWGTHVLA